MRFAKSTIALAGLMLAVCAAPAGASVRDQVLDPSCVSEIELTAPEASIANLYADPLGDYQPATMTFDLCGAGTSVFGPLNVTMRLKGSGSFRTLDGKAAFKVKMPKGQRIDELKSLTLNNMVQDRSSVHEVIAFEAYRAAGLMAPRVGYANVRLNGLDYGLHANVETLDSRFLNETFIGDWQHLYEAPDWREGHVTHQSRDIVPESVANFEVDEGDEDSVADLSSLAASMALVDDEQWWQAFQDRFDVTSVLRYWATSRLIGDWDAYPHNVNNYYLLSDANDVFRFLPWGTDQTLDVDLPIFPETENGSLIARCLGHLSCRPAYRTELGAAAEAILSIDLVSRARALQTTIEAAVLADSRTETTPIDQCRAVNAMIDFLLARETLWASEFREPGTVVGPAQSTERLACPEPTAETGPTAGTGTIGGMPSTHAPDLTGGAVRVGNGTGWVSHRRVGLSFNWPVDATGVEVANDRDFAQSESFARVAGARWRLASGPSGKRSRRVYARFLGEGGERGETIVTRVVLDYSAPVLVRVRVRELPFKRGPRGTTHRYVLELNARDEGSGVEAIEVRAFDDRDTRTLRVSSAGQALLATSSARIKLRMLDRAGNAGEWRSVMLVR